MRLGSRGPPLGNVLGGGRSFWVVVAVAASLLALDLGALAKPSSDPAGAARLLGGEALVYQFDADDRGVPGSTADAARAHVGAVSGAQVVPGRFGDAYFFGRGARVTTSDAADLDMGRGDFTLMAWVKTTTTDPAAAIIDKYQSDDGSGYMLKLQGCAGCVVLLLNERGNWEQRGGSARVNDGQWHHVAAVRDDVQHAIYIDGALVSTWTSAFVRDVSSPAPLSVGHAPAYGQHFPGEIDEVRVYTRALTGAEIRDISILPYDLGYPPPTTSASFDGVDGAEDWYRSAVSVTLACTAAPGTTCTETYYRIDGGAWALYAGPFIVAREGTTTLEFYSAARDSEEAAIMTASLRIDATAPLLLAADDVEAEAVSASGSDATFDAPTATDAGSGVGPVACDAASGQTFPLGETIVTCSATDAAGNVGTVTFRIAIRDTTPPSLSSARDVVAEARGPDGADVHFELPIALDAVAGALEVSCAPASGSRFALGSTRVTCSANDAAGNEGTTTFFVTVRDTTPPALDLPREILATATDAHGASLAYFASAFDAVSGAIVPSCAPASGARFALGATLVACSATDEAGNEGRGAFFVQVSYAWSGFHDLKSEARQGSAVRLKFTLDGVAQDIGAKLFVARVDSTAPGEPASSKGGGGNVFSFDPETREFALNLDTKPLTKGTHEVRLDLGDGWQRTARMTVK